MPTEPHATEIAHTIQLAVAPVFLLSALGTILSVLSSRLGRIVDRARVISDRLAGLESSSQALLLDELQSLARRRKLVNHAITACTSAALLVCLLIAFAFLEYLVGADFPQVLAGLFIAAMAAFITGLLCFLREVLLAVASIRLGSHGT